MTPDSRTAHQRFVNALEGGHQACDKVGCAGPIDCLDVSAPGARVKTFAVRCLSCGWRDEITGVEEAEPPWDEASLLVMADEHLMHHQPICPNDGTPVVFTSLPNPRRRARYRVSCYFCGRQADMDWPPPEPRR